jgi:hypothetical protein
MLMMLLVELDHWLLYLLCSSQWLALHLLVLGSPSCLPCTFQVLGLLLAASDLD